MRVLFSGAELDYRPMVKKLSEDSVMSFNGGELHQLIEARLVTRKLVDLTVLQWKCVQWVSCLGTDFKENLHLRVYKGPG